MDFGRLVFGANVLGWTVHGDEAFALLDHCVARGVTCFDTADHYVTWTPDGQGGESEAIIGRWLAQRGRSDDLSIITKVGFEMRDGSKGLSRAHILRSIDASLDRLQRSHVDLYMAHLEDPDTPIEETMEAFAELIEAGKVREIGVSQLGASTIVKGMEFAARHGLPSFTVFETLYNLYEREPFESDGAQLAARYGFQVLPFRSLAAGYLTGKYRAVADLAQSVRGARAGGFMDARGARILAAMDLVSAQNDATLTQIAVAWLRDRPHVAALLAGATRREQLDEQLAGAELVLDPRHVALLDEASAY